MSCVSEEKGDRRMSSNLTKVLVIGLVLMAVSAVAVGAQTATTGPVGVSTTVSKQCYSVPCHGSANREAIYERIGDGKHDIIRGYGNNDRIHANTYSGDTDRVYGHGGGTNYLYVDDGDALDGAIGGPGFDYCYVDATIEASDTCDSVVFR